jgi:hypothetical protein
VLPSLFASVLSVGVDTSKTRAADDVAALRVALGIANDVREATVRVPTEGAGSASESRGVRVGVRWTWIVGTGVDPVLPAAGSTGTIAYRKGFVDTVIRPRAYRLGERAHRELPADWPTVWTRIL